MVEVIVAKVITTVPNSRNTLSTTPQNCLKVGGLIKIKWTCDPSQQSQIFSFKKKMWSHIFG